jgi:DNA polymerase III sliding clamp (beta) subunit (PCNA family)
MGRLWFLKRYAMKVTFNRSALAEALGLMTSIVPSRTPKPILKCVRIAVSGKEMRICATNLELGLDCLLSEVEVG